MDHYSAERLLLDENRRRIREAERRALLTATSSVSLRAWMAWRLRSLADRIDGAALARPHRPTA
jgi:hypothetical protein